LQIPMRLPVQFRINELEEGVRGIGERVNTPVA
jgi:hypothetical protein